VDEYPDTIGFELVVPRLVDRAHHAGMPLPYEQLRSIEKIRDAKLAKIPRERLFDRAGNLAFSAEFLTDAGAAQLRGLKSANGSYACSPSASAAAWAVTGDPDTWSYLESIATTDGGAAPAIFPMDVFDRAWVLGPLAGAGLLGPAAAPVGRYLADALGPDGAPASRVGPAPDSDTTAMSILAAQAVGQDCAGKLAALLRYETTDHFRCFAFERDPSISANARIRHALASNGPDRFATQINKADSFLADVRTGSGYWGDKWHLSPYYTTAVVVAGGRDRTWSWAPTTSWLLESQRDNGSWGVYSGSSEETAYAVAMLDSLTDAGDPRAGHAIAKAAAYLVGDRDAEHAELWIAKGLYAPLNVISAYVLAALAVCRRRLVAQA
jgi:halimadienyl-diphosphate synthase